MEVTLPVFVHSGKIPGERETTYSAQLLFLPYLHGQDSSLQRAMQKLMRRTRKELNQMGSQWDHLKLSRAVMNPELQSQRLKLSLDLKSRRGKLVVFVVVLRLSDRFVAFSPHIPDFWFQIDSLIHLEQRATEVYQHYFRLQEQSQDPHRLTVESASLDGQAWVSAIDVDLQINQKSPADNVKELLALWDEETLDGANELNKVGRCLDWLYPDDLQRATGRDEQADALRRVLDLPDQRSVLLVGPHLVGKTNLIHETVFRRVDARQKKQRTKRNTWLLSPQRLISGMMYVGQWENRLLAIMEEAQKRQHILYFDDLIGLFHAGKSRDSDLCVADLLKNSIQSRSIRVLAEITPEALEVLNQIDRSFAEMFHVIRLEAMPRDQMVSLLINVKTDYELKHRCWFDLAVLPKIIELTERYQRNAAFPGKAVKVLKELSVRKSRHSIDVDDVYTTFRNSTGLSFKLVRDDQKVEHEDILNALHAKIVGQDHAIDACADVVGVAKARMNDPHRPLATMLFLGPTGVGKTETAKALTDFLFENEQALIRFDLNQYKSSYSAALLVGTPDRPEGLLTQAVSQRPFCILLLDEVEKAHPDVLEVLLQVLGEGRLTDAHGRTTDFTNCIIILTSNLGTASAAKQIGYTASETQHRFIQAARKFFRPEFFNRIDRIIPFHPLSREQIRQIADGLMRDVIAREGLARRNCVLQVEPTALENIADQGFHPELGARAMRRAIEQQFVAPVSRRLAAIVSDSPTVISASAGEHQLDVYVEPLENQPHVAHWNLEPDIEALSKAAERFEKRIRETWLAEKPAGEISAGGMSPELLRYYAIGEQLNEFLELTQSFRAQFSTQQSQALPQIKTAFRNTGTAPADIKGMLAADDIESYLNEVSMGESRDGKDLVDLARNIQSEAAFLELVASGNADDRCLFVLKMDGRMTNRVAGMIIKRLTLAYYSMFKNKLGFDVQLKNVEASEDHGSVLTVMELAGPSAIAIAQREATPNLFFDMAGRLLMLQVAIIPANWVDTDGIEGALLRAYRMRFQSAKENVEANPFEILPMCRVYHSGGKTFDYRTQTRLDNWPDAEKLYELLIGGLELPEEFR